MLLSHFGRGWFARKLLASGSVSQAEMESVKSNLEAAWRGCAVNGEPWRPNTRGGVDSQVISYYRAHPTAWNCSLGNFWGLKIILIFAWFFIIVHNFSGCSMRGLCSRGLFQTGRGDVLGFAVTTFPDVSDNASNHVLVADSKGWLWSCTQKHAWKDMGNWVATKWEGFVRPTDKASSHPTGVDLELLKKIGAKLCEVPEGWDGISWRFAKALFKLCSLICLGCTIEPRFL